MIMGSTTKLLPFDVESMSSPDNIIMWEYSLHIFVSYVKAVTQQNKIRTVQKAPL